MLTLRKQDEEAAIDAQSEETDEEAAIDAQSEETR